MTPVFRCSSLDRDLACNGAIVLSPMVDPRTGDEGDMGTALHHLSATRICAELGASAPDGLGPHDSAWPSLKASGWISDYYIRHVRDNVPHDWALEVEAALSYEFELDAPREMTVVEWIDGRPVITRKPVTHFILSGHIDCFAISPDGTEAMGWDLKSGYIPTDSAEQSWQMLGYILLLKRAYPQLRTVTFFIVQPRNDEDEGFQRVSSVRLGEGVDLETVTKTFVGVVARSIENSGTVTSGRVQCRFCPVALQCAATIADRESMKMTLTPEALASIKRTPDDATLANWVISAKTLERPMEDAKELAKERIASQGAIVASDGTQITVKTSKGSYRVLNPDGLWATLHELLPAPMLAACAKWSFSNVRDKIADHMGIPKTGKAAVTAEGVFDAKIRPHVEQGERQTFQYL